MKKILFVLTLVSFVALNAVNAQTPAATATVDNKEASATPTASVAKENPAAIVKDAAHPGCCQKGATAKSCCKAGSSAKACSPAEKARCAEKMKAEAAVPATPAAPEAN